MHIIFRSTIKITHKIYSLKLIQEKKFPITFISPPKGKKGVAKDTKNNGINMKQIQISEIKTIILIIMLNINGINASIKWQRFVDQITKHNPIVSCLQET